MLSGSHGLHTPFPASYISMVPQFWDLNVSNVFFFFFTEIGYFKESHLCLYFIELLEQVFREKKKIYGPGRIA